jgi:hypothetical protein
MKIKINKITIKKHMARVSDLGCLVCNAEAQVHHIRLNGEKNDMNVIPLCYMHHTGDFSIHKTPREFEKTVGSDLELLAKTNAALLERDLCII